MILDRPAENPCASCRWLSESSCKLREREITDGGASCPTSLWNPTCEVYERPSPLQTSMATMIEAAIEAGDEEFERHSTRNIVQKSR